MPDLDGLVGSALKFGVFAGKGGIVPRRCTEVWMGFVGVGAVVDVVVGAGGGIPAVLFDHCGRDSPQRLESVRHVTEECGGLAHRLAERRQRFALAVV